MKYVRMKDRPKMETSVYVSMNELCEGDSNAHSCPIALALRKEFTEHRPKWMWDGSLLDISISGGNAAVFVWNNKEVILHGPPEKLSSYFPSDADGKGYLANLTPYANHFIHRFDGIDHRADKKLSSTVEFWKQSMVVHYVKPFMFDLKWKESHWSEMPSELYWRVQQAMKFWKVEPRDKISLHDND